MKTGRRRRRRARRTFRLTREGKAFLGVTVGVGLAAVNTGNNLLYLVLGLMLSLLLVSGVLSDLALLSIRVRRNVPQRLFAEATSLVEIIVANGKRFIPSFSLEVEDLADDEPNERRCYFLKIAPRGDQVAAYRRTPGRRGVLRLSAFRVATRYPFGLIEKGRHFEDAIEVLVYPALVPVPRVDLSRALTGKQRPTGRPGMGTEIVGVREYRPGDEARAIHWRRTASLGRLVVREHERDAHARLALALDNAAPDPEDADWRRGFEQAIREAASIAADANTRGAAVELVVRGARSPLVLPGAPLDPVWAFLARLEAMALEGAPAVAATGGHVHVVPVRPQADAPVAEAAA